MGASTSFRTYKKELGQEKIKDLWRSAVEASLYEDGHSYSGEIGMLGPNIARWHDLDMPINAAYEYIETHHEKWRPAIAVSAHHNGLKFWVIGGWCSS